MNSVNVIFLVMTTTGLAVGQEDCFPVETINQKAYFNWPIHFDCYEVAEECEFLGSYKCSVIANGTNETLFTEDYEYDYYVYNDGEPDHPIFKIEYVTMDTPSEIVIKLQNLDGGDCCTKHVSLQKQSVPDYSCPSKCEDSFPTEPTNQRTYFCTNTDDTEPDLEFGYPVTWSHNCNTTLPEGIVVDGDKLSISSFDQFKHPGNYSCSAQLGNETRKIRTLRVCAKLQNIDVKITMTCTTDKIRYNVGENATITCDVGIGSGKINSVLYTMVFYPLFASGSRDDNRDNASCTSILDTSGGNVSPDPRFSCAFKTKLKNEEPCFFDILTPEEWEIEKNTTQQKLQMTYVISNIQRSDFGLYEAYASRGKSNDATNVVEIKEETGDADRATRIGVALGITILILLIGGVLLFVFWLDIRICWRRSKCSKCDQDRLTYGAYFAYFWSDEESAGDSHKAYGDLIDGMQKEIRKMGFDIYDPAQTGWISPYSSENVRLAQSKCDRIVVILTSQLLQEPRALQTLYGDFLEKPYILVKTPEFRKRFRSLDYERRKGLTAHFQRNFVITWSGKGGQLSAKFRKQLELAMPKIDEKNQKSESRRGNKGRNEPNQYETII